MTTNKPSKLGIGLALGAILGGVAAFFLSPRSGPENRAIAKKKIDELIKLLKEKNLQEIATEIFGKASEEGTKLYGKARSELDRHLSELKKGMSEIDREKYKFIVADVIERVKGEKEATQERLSKLQHYLIGRFDEVQDMAKKDAKTVVKSAEKAVKS